MARIEGADPKQTSFLMRQVFKKVRKMLGRDLTPQKIVTRVPRVFLSVETVRNGNCSVLQAYNFAA